MKELMKNYLILYHNECKIQKLCIRLINKNLFLKFMLNLFLLHWYKFSIHQKYIQKHVNSTSICLSAHYIQELIKLKKYNPLIILSF